MRLTTRLLILAPLAGALAVASVVTTMLSRMIYEEWVPEPIDLWVEFDAVDRSRSVW